MKSLHHALVALALCAFTGAVFSGCQQNDVRRFRVFGRATFDGKDLPAGRIYFEPDSSRGNSGASGYAEIVEGRFDTDKNGKGSIGGPMIIRVNGHEKPTSLNDESSPVRTYVRDYEERVELPKGATEWNVAIPKDRGEESR
jgi:hypothetical protein